MSSERVALLCVLCRVFGDVFGDVFVGVVFIYCLHLPHAAVGMSYP